LVSGGRSPARANLKLRSAFVVISFKKKGPRKFKPHALAIGLLGKDAAEILDRAVIVLPRDSNQAVKKNRLVVVRVLLQCERKNALGVFETIRLDQQRRGRGQRNLLLIGNLGLRLRGNEYREA